LSWDGVGLFQLVSGYQLIVSVLAIRNFFKARNDEKYINTKMLMRHASAFGLFMVTDLVRYIAFSFYALHPEDPTVLNVYLIAKIFWILGSFLS
jgi:hypothetical protein